MSWRPVAWLVAAIGAAGLFIALFERGLPQGRLATFVEAPLLRLDAGAVTRLSVATPALKAECALKEGRWRLMQPVETRADAAAIRRILDALRHTMRQETISVERQAQRGLTLASFGLDAPRARLWVGTDQRQDEVAIGAPAPLGAQVYVMTGAGGDVVAVSRDIEGAIPAGLEALRDRSVVPADFEKLNRVEVKHRHGFLQLVFRGGEWRIQQPQDARADGAAVERLIGVLRGLQVERFVQASSSADPVAYGMGRDEAALELSVWQEGSPGRIEVTVGKASQDAPGLVYARISDIGGVCLLPAECVPRLAATYDELRDRRLCDATPDIIQSVLLRDGENKLELKRLRGAEWVITDPIRTRADTAVVGGMLRRLCDVQAEPVVDAVASNAFWQAGSSGVWQVVVSTAGGQATNAVGPGEPAAVRTWSYTMARKPSDGWRLVVDGEAKQVSRIRAVDFPGTGLNMEGGSLTDTLLYMDRRVLYVESASVRRITLASGGVEESVVRDASGRWAADSPPEAKVKEDAVTSLLGLLNDIRAIRIASTKVEDPDVYGLGEKAARLILGLAGTGGIQKTLVFGGKTPDGHVYATLQGQDVVFVLRRKTVEALTRKFVAGP